MRKHGDPPNTPTNRAGRIDAAQRAPGRISTWTVLRLLWASLASWVDKTAIQKAVTTLPRLRLEHYLNTPCVPGRVQNEILRRLVLEDDLALYP